ncbi:MAG: TolC family protein [Candidatus Muirbacterium halophilum]|nr:TolC family protein [Candidatus Muirbacterium halophilum]MCK9475019.1 TolC family protein [Candidatus Muirbacterium halophilum]
MKIKKNLSLIVIIFMCLSVSANSFGLRELLDMTVDLNPDIKIQDILLENSIMTRKIKSNETGFPDISLSYSQTRDKYPGVSAKENGLFSLRLSKTFPGLFMTDKFKDSIASLNLQKDKLKYQTIKNNLIFTSYDYYFRIVRKVNELEVHRTNVKLLEELLSISKINVEAGTGLKSDVLRVEAQKINNEIMFETTKNELKNIMLGLNAFLNNSYRDLYNAVVMFLETGGDLTKYGIDPAYKFKSQKFDIENIVNNNLENLPDIKMYKKDIDLMRDSMQIAKNAFYPDFNLNVSKTEVDHTDSPLTVKDNDYSISMVFTQKLYDQGTTGLKIKQAQNLLKTADINYNYQKSIKEAVLRENISSYEESVWRTEASEKSFAHARENMRLVSERYKAGDAGVIELIDAQILMTNNQLSSLKAYYDERINLGNIYKNINSIDELWRLSDEKR